MQFRSSIYTNIFPDELMLSAFGNLMPSQSHKNEYFFNCWMDWKVNEMRVSTRFPPSTFKKEIKDICNQIGLREFWDYQTRGYTIRFKYAEILAFFKISAGDKWTM